MGRFDRAGRGYEYVTNAKSCEKADLVVAARDCERDFRPDRFLRFKNGVYARRERHGYGGTCRRDRNVYCHERNARMVVGVDTNYRCGYSRACRHLFIDFRVYAENGLDQVWRFKAGFVKSTSNLTPENTLQDVLDLKEKNGHSTVAITHDGTANGTVTRHNMFAATACPGKYLQSKFPYITEQVNKR